MRRQQSLYGEMKVEAAQRAEMAEAEAARRAEAEAERANRLRAISEERRARRSHERRVVRMSFIYRYTMYMLVRPQKV